MNIDLREYITELNQNYNDLGEDLVMLEAVLSAPAEDMGFPGEYAASSLERIRDYTRQHIKEIDLLADCLVRRQTALGGRVYFSRTAEK